MSKKCKLHYWMEKVTKYTYILFCQEILVDNNEKFAICVNTRQDVFSMWLIAYNKLAEWWWSLNSFNHPFKICVVASQSTWESPQWFIFRIIWIIVNLHQIQNYWNNLLNHKILFLIMMRIQRFSLGIIKITVSWNYWNVTVASCMKCRNYAPSMGNYINLIASMIFK